MHVRVAPEVRAERKLCPPAENLEAEDEAVGWRASGKEFLVTLSFSTSAVRRSFETKNAL